LKVVYEELKSRGKIDKRRKYINSISFYNVSHFFTLRKLKRGRRGTIMPQI